MFTFSMRNNFRVINRPIVKINSKLTTDAAKDETTLGNRTQPRRKFRQDWLQQFSWLQERNGNASCIACEKELYNHLSALHKHSKNNSHVHNMARLGIEIDRLKCCRLCAKLVKSRDLQKLFSPRYRTKLQKIEELTGLQLQDDNNLPDLVCILCNSEVERMLQFRERCLQAQKYFQSDKYKQQQSQNDHNESGPSQEEEAGGLDHTGVCGSALMSNETQTSYSHGTVEQLWLAEESTDLAEVVGDQVHDECTETIKRSRESEEEHLDVDNTYEDKMELYPERECEIYISKQEEEEQEFLPIENEDKSELYSERKCTTFICDQCGNNFTCRHLFTMHMRRHAGDKRVQCELCPEKFFTNSELNRHMRRHTGEKPFGCRHCDRRFTDYSNRVKHERTHTNDRPFSCGQCGKAFTTSYVLKNHMLTHTGERSFVCTLCNKAFSRATNLAMHKSTIIHKQNEEKQKLAGGADVTGCTDVLEDSC